MIFRPQKSTQFKPDINIFDKLPLPERITFKSSKIQNPFISEQNEKFKLHNSLILGLPFVGELYRRLTKSENCNNGTYYAYVAQIIPTALKIIECMYGISKKAEININESEVQCICFQICDFLTWSMSQLQDTGFMRMIDAKIINTVNHPSISINYPIKQISIVKLIKDDDSGLSLQRIAGNYFCV